jgi:CRISPR-associated endonuclease/helicase Cas3
MDNKTTNQEPLAHSARKQVTAQSYEAHIRRVTAIATRSARRATRYYRRDRKFFVDTVRVAALFHDLGKLDDKNQQVLMRSATEKLPIKHWDASSAYLLSQHRMESAVLAYAHHRGLPDYLTECTYGERAFRVQEEFDRTNQFLADFITRHEAIIGKPVKAIQSQNAGWSGLTRRLALSCLVDGDHTDTAEHYGSERPQRLLPLRPAERLQTLDEYVGNLASNEAVETERNRLRRTIYFACRDASTETSMQACDSPVGTGKTTAMMAHLLRAAIDKNLRHVFVVLPYTNIIRQSVKAYRKALCLPGENPEEVVAEHHHQADFSSREFRHLAQLWNAPITVTTAVQFFETLGSKQPSRLRKLHEIAGSAILIDESHAAMPAWLWPQMWSWLVELADQWGCHIVFASGSLVRFWELGDFVGSPIRLPELVGEETRQQALGFEAGRVSYHTHDEPLNLETLVDFVLSKPGPRLVILNTVQSTAVFANAMREQCGKQAVSHLSTALCPIHREAIIAKLGERLLNREDTDWTLVATSCVEAGVDFSFRTAFRETCGLVNLVQIGGRANRSGEHPIAEVWDFHVSDSRLPPHPAFQASQEVLDELFKESAVELLSSTEAIRREIQRETIQKRRDKLKDLEQKMNYPEVSKLCRLIDSDTRVVVIDAEIVAALERREKVTYSELVKHSVQIWANKLKLLPVREVQGNDELLAWAGNYDAEFLGYMVGAIPLLEAQATGAMIF